MPTEMELTLEQTQQGASYEVSNIRVILFTMKMEILLEPTSNKLKVDPHGFEGIFKDGNGEMLKKFGLEDSKPMKTPMSSATKLTKDEECESVDSTKYRGMIGEMTLDDELRYTKSYVPTISNESYIPDFLKPTFET
ncbi:hypothetical protein Tco_0448510 [Tanacetum coccineum]